MEKHPEEQPPTPGKKSVLNDKTEFEKDKGKDTVSHMGDQSGKGRADRPPDAARGTTRRS